MRLGLYGIDGLEYSSWLLLRGRRRDAAQMAARLLGRVPSHAATIRL